MEELRVCVVTGSRSEYGLLRPVLSLLKSAPGVHLSVVATGMHLAAEFGSTYTEIERDGYTIAEKIDTLTSGDSPADTSRSIGQGFIGFADVWDRLRPDVVLVLGDRFEIFAAAASAYVCRIPVAHMSGGDVTEGAIDEGIRHSITKMSALHFVSNEEARRRVLQMGEQPDAVFNVGGTGVDNALSTPEVGLDEASAVATLDLATPTLLVTHHPVTLAGGAAQEMSQLFGALDQLDDFQVVFTKSNADAEGRLINRLIDQWVEAHRDRARAFVSLGAERYLALMRHCAAVVGNSSSGIIEAPSMHKPTVNIGDRQRGRMRAASVIDVPAEAPAIAAAILQATSPAFTELCRTVANPYGDGHAAERIVDILLERGRSLDARKRFNDLKGLE